MTEQFNWPAHIKAHPAAESRLRLVQSELRQITGTPIKDEADRQRRMALWRELDELVREALS
jgi:hypothetical protein